MDEALYHPQFGYYSSTRNPLGREGDFYTSSDLDPIFGKLLARRFSAMAEELNVPADPSRLWSLAPGAACWRETSFNRKQFPYRILERSAAMRERQREVLAGL